MRVLIGALSVLCASVVFATAEDTIVLSGLPVWDSAPLLALAKDQPLRARGTVFEFQPWRAPEELAAKIFRGDVHVVSAPAILLPILTNRGLKLDLLGMTAPKGSVKILAKDAVGPIAVPFKGGMPDLILQALYDAAPGTVRPVRYTATPVEAMQLLLTGQVGAAFLPEPLATIAEAKSPEPLSKMDACAAWQEAFKVVHCPVTGVYIASGVETDDLVRALAEKVADLSTRSHAVQTLLQAEFAVLEGAPLAGAFDGFSANFFPACNMDALQHTLSALAPFAPVPLTLDAVDQEAC